MSAIFSPCRTWRYTLERNVGFSEKTLLVIGVNPSTADENKNDATIRKDIGFAERWGYGRLLKGNVFAFRSTDIKGLRSIEDPVGPDNLNWLTNMFHQADLIVGAWGTLEKLPKHLRQQWREVVTISKLTNKEIRCFGKTLDGQPLHPLYTPYDRPHVRWDPPV